MQKHLVLNYDHIQRPPIAPLTLSGVLDQPRLKYAIRVSSYSPTAVWVDATFQQHIFAPDRGDTAMFYGTYQVLTPAREPGALGFELLTAGNRLMDYLEIPQDRADQFLACLTLLTQSILKAYLNKLEDLCWADAFTRREWNLAIAQETIIQLEQALIDAKQELESLYAGTAQ